MKHFRRWWMALATVLCPVHTVPIAIKMMGGQFQQNILNEIQITLTLRSILVSFRLWSSAFRSIPTLSRSSYCCNASMSSAFAASSAANSFSSVVSSTGESSSVRRSTSFRCLPLTGSSWFLGARDFSAPAEAQDIWANISSCEARDLR
jgi:hypothetical protein